MRSAVRSRAEPDPAAIRLTIERFLDQCKRPALVRPGEGASLLGPGSWRLSLGPRGVLLEAWGPGLNLTRRITAARSTRGRLELRCVQFSGRSAILYLQDESARRAATAKLGSHRGGLGFERLVQREFTGAKIIGLTRARDLERSLSGRHYRARLRERGVEWAFVGAAEDSNQQDCDDALVTGLIWLAELRKNRERHIAGLRVMVPLGRSATSAERMARLQPRLGAYELYEYHARGGKVRVDLADSGNVDIRLPHRARPQDLPELTRRWVAELQNVGAEAVTQADGSRSVRLNGIEFAKAGSWGLKYGIHVERPAAPESWPEVLRLAQSLAGFRRADPPDPLNPLYTASEESWMECCVRAQPRALDPGLVEDPIYSQTPALAGLERGLIDLLAVGRDGRLTIIELKTSESLRLPLQALDYWTRVEACRVQGLFEKRGYFSGHVLADFAPRALLVAPGLHFHPATETLLQFLPIAMEVERVGLASDWRRELSVVFRKRGPERLA